MTDETCQRLQRLCVEI